MVEFSIKFLAEHSEHPEVQLHEMLQLLMDFDKYDEFDPSDWPRFFQQLYAKYSQVSRKLTESE